MHRTFFPGEKAELGGYDFYQSRITGIFTGGHYNCLSSAVLYAVLARGFGMPVRAAFVPTHVFVEMGTPGGKIIEVETTSATGFDWIHDAALLQGAGGDLVGDQRGLRPTTLDEYQHRKIVEPYRLMAEAMLNSHRGESDQDRSRAGRAGGRRRSRRSRGAAGPDPRLHNEGHDLYEAKAWRTMARLFDTVRPAVTRSARRARTPRRWSWCRGRTGTTRTR